MHEVFVILTKDKPGMISGFLSGIRKAAGDAAAGEEENEKRGGMGYV